MGESIAFAYLPVDLAEIGTEVEVEVFGEGRGHGGPGAARSRRERVRLMEQPRFDLEGRVALVTGASRGIGRDLVVALAGAGATVAAAIGGRRRRRRGGGTGDGGRAEAVGMDLTDRSSIDRAIDEAVERCGRLDVLVNNAGLGTNHDALDATEEEWDELFAVNVRGLFFACQSGPAHGRSGFGRTVNMASQAGLVGIPRHAAYSASKGARRAHAGPGARVGASGVTVNCVAPTFVRTPGTAERLKRPDFLADVLERSPSAGWARRPTSPARDLLPCPTPPRSSPAPSSSWTAAGPPAEAIRA